MTATFVTSPWNNEFVSLITSARSSLILCSPFVTHQPCETLIQRTLNREIDLLLVTNLGWSNLFNGTTDLGAIIAVADAFPNIKVQFLPSLHAKVYVADDTAAIVTSGNLTGGGLFRNFEYGVAFRAFDEVRRIRSDICSYSDLGTTVGLDSLRHLQTIVSQLRAVHGETVQSSRRSIHAEFERLQADAEVEVLRVRAAGRTAHAIFAQVILYALRNGPLSTAELHQQVKAVHPDLCDDTVDRVIDNRHFGKKWKHGVRTAQVYLRRKGQIELCEGKWRLLPTR